MNRIARFREQLRPQNLPNFLVARLSNARYLRGFTGSAGVLLITPKKARFFRDFRYKEQAAIQITDTEAIIYKDELIKELKRHPLKLQGKIGFESSFMDVGTYSQF